MAVTERSRRLKRIKVAKDVIAQVRAKKFVAEAGVYGLFEGVESTPENKQSSSLRRLAKKAKKCTVCALGSVFVSASRVLEDQKVSIYFYNENEGESDVDAFSGGDVHEALGDLFGHDQLGLIESAFEMSAHHARWADDGYGVAVDKKVIDRAVAFGDRYGTDRGRLIGIMNNIIKNDGTFVP
jgi:hypothetical protein